MKLKNYAPAGNQILLEVREYTRGTIIMLKPEADKITKVLKVGPTVTALNPITNEKIKVGDFVMMNGNMLMQLEFEDENKQTVVALQGSDFNIASFYLPDADETQYYAPIKESIEETTRNLNVIDNPGIDQSPYLKEERDNQVKLVTS